MQGYARTTPGFSLCGLNCALCPRYNTDGSSRCPGCGGLDFRLKHPACAVIGCSRRHGNVEYCFACEKYPCDRYLRTGEKDSFISYRNVLEDNEKARADLGRYLSDLEKKKEYLDYFLEKYNDGKSKGFFCLAINLLPIEDIEEIAANAKEKEKPEGPRTEFVKSLFHEKARNRGIEIALRK
ncbi:MAG TPA: hypothetical protein DCQ16_00325 [Spirochaetaceae bacterium]|nr:hypothetical protein [Spirochaetaceae bacterium]